VHISGVSALIPLAIRRRYVAGTPCCSTV